MTVTLRIVTFALALLTRSYSLRRRPIPPWLREAALVWMAVRCFITLAIITSASAGYGSAQPRLISLQGASPHTLALVAPFLTLPRPHDAARISAPRAVAIAQARHPWRISQAVLTRIEPNSADGSSPPDSGQLAWAVALFTPQGSPGDGTADSYTVVLVDATTGRAEGEVAVRATS